MVIQHFTNVSSTLMLSCDVTLILLSVHLCRTPKWTLDIGRLHKRCPPPGSWLLAMSVLPPSSRLPSAVSRRCQVLARTTTVFYVLVKGTWYPSDSTSRYRMVGFAPPIFSRRQSQTHTLTLCSQSTSSIVRIVS